MTQPTTDELVTLGRVLHRVLTVNDGGYVAGGSGELRLDLRVYLDDVENEVVDRLLNPPPSPRELAQRALDSALVHHTRMTASAFCVQCLVAGRGEEAAAWPCEPLRPLCDAVDAAPAA